jgi:hypothetical protein
MAVALASCGDNVASKKQLTTFEERSSYAIGQNVGGSLSRTVRLDVATGAGTVKSRNQEVPL